MHKNLPNDKPFLRRGRKARLKKGAACSYKDRGMSSVAPKGEGGNVRNLAYLALQENRQNFLNEKLDM